MPESFVNQATGRLSVTGSKMWFNCNPDGPYHWFKVNWIDKKKEKRLIYLHFTMDDNLSLSEEIKKRYRSMYSGVFFQRYILGMWTVAEGVIFDMFDRARHIYNKLVDTIASETYVSCDYGTQNATVFLLWQKGVDGVWYCIKEFYYSGRENKKQKTDGEFADELEKFIEGYKVKRIVIDPSAASFIAELKSRGLRIKKANNDVLDGIRYTGSMLNDDKIRFSPECKNTIQEFSAYIWDKKAADKGEDKPVKDHDHAMDAVRYFCYTITRKKGGISVWK